MNPSGDSTHRPDPIDPQQFRAQATGIGQTRSASLATGAMRAQCVVDAPGCTKAKAPAREGFPASTAEKFPELAASMASVPGTVLLGPSRLRGR